MNYRTLGKTGFQVSEIGYGAWGIGKSSWFPGMRSLRNVDQNCALGDGHGLPAETLEKLKIHRWNRNFYQ